MASDWEFERQPTTQEVTSLITEAEGCGMWFDLIDKGKGRGYTICPHVMRSITRSYIDGNYRLVPQDEEGQSLAKRFPEFFQMAESVRTNILRKNEAKHRWGFLKCILKMRLFREYCIGKTEVNIDLKWGLIPYRPITSYQRHFMKSIMTLAAKVLMDLNNAKRTVEQFVQGVEKLNADRAQRVVNAVQFNGLSYVQALNLLPEIYAQSADAKEYYTNTDTDAAKKEVLRVIEKAEEKGYRYAVIFTEDDREKPIADDKKPDFRTNATGIPAQAKRIRDWRQKSKNEIVYTKTIPQGRKCKRLRLKCLYTIVMMDIDHCIIRFGPDAYVQLWGSPMGSPLSNMVAYYGSAVAMRTTPRLLDSIFEYDFVDDVYNVREVERVTQEVRDEVIPCYYGKNVKFEPTSGSEYLGLDIEECSKFLDVFPKNPHNQANVPSNIPKRVRRSTYFGNIARQANQSVFAYEYFELCKAAAPRQ